MAQRDPHASDERGADIPGSVGRNGLLIRLSGADVDVLARTPRERRKFTALGGVVLTTATMAAASAAFALHVGARAPLVVAIPIGLLWGLAIMNLDRWLVAAGQRRDRWYQNLVVALPRLALALVIGAVISTPLVLWIFDREINAELDAIQQRRLSAHQEKLLTDARFERIPFLQEEVERLQKIVDGEVQIDSVTDDPTVKRLQKQYDAAYAEFRKAENEAICERDGTCGTGVPGAAAEYWEKRERADRLQQEAADLKRRLDAAIAAAEGQSADVVANTQTSAAEQLADHRSELERLASQKQQEEDEFAASVRNDRGLLARMDALTNFTNHSATLKTAYLALLLFITAIEVLPVLVKFLMNLGPPTAYDLILRGAERRDVENATRAFDHERVMRERRFERMASAEAELHERAVENWQTRQLREVDADPTRFLDSPEQTTRPVGLSGRVRTVLRPWSGTSRVRRRAVAESEYEEWPAEDVTYPSGAEDSDDTTRRWRFGD